MNTEIKRSDKEREATSGVPSDSVLNVWTERVSHDVLVCGWIREG